MIERTTLKMQAYDYLKECILDGTLKPDVMYTEQSFAKELNISRTPVREAVLQLVYEDFVEIKPNKGFMVRQYSEKEFKQYLQMRTAIEGFCCMYAAERAKTSECKKLIEKLENYIEQQKEIIESGNNVKNFIDNDFCFHLAIVEYCQNAQMTSIFTDMRRRMDNMWLKNLSTGGKITSAYKKHIENCEAIKNEKRYDVYLIIEEHLYRYLSIFKENSK